MWSHDSRTLVDDSVFIHTTYVYCICICIYILYVYIYIYTCSTCLVTTYSRIWWKEASKVEGYCLVLTRVPPASGPSMSALAVDKLSNARSRSLKEAKRVLKWKGHGVGQFLPVKHGNLFRPHNVMQKTFSSLKTINVFFTSQTCR